MRFFGIWELGSKGRSVLGLVVRVVVSGALLTILAYSVDLREVSRELASIQPVFLVFALLIEIGLTAVATIRWQLVLGSLDVWVGFPAALRNLWVGIFFNQTLPSAIGGDALRMYEARRLGISLRVSISSVLVDRLMGLAAVVVLVVLGQPFYFAVVPDQRMAWGLAAVAVAGVAGFAVLLAFPSVRPLWLRGRLWDMIAALADDFRALVRRPRHAVAALSLSILMQIGTGCLIWILAAALGISLPVWIVILMMMPIVLFTMLPISIAGWGTREGAFVVGFGILGVAAPEALALSVLYGIFLIVFSLPGGALWLVIKRSAAVQEAGRTGASP
ncbi:MAG: flippase-like domain-containing protein [Alphaproteobacteria bacterium]|nr:flippase-like domain-containing protein [Alphaproteobacteria bacterium]